MMKFLRKHRNTLMIVIAVLAVPFVFYFNKTDLSARGPGDVARIYGRNLSLVEAQRYGKLYGLAMALGMSDFVQDLAAGARDDNERSWQFIINLLILRHEAGQLGIQPGASEVIDFVRSLAAFQGPSGFDMKKYTEFTQQLLSPNGFSEGEVEDLARDALSLRRIKQIVAMGISTPQSEMKQNFDEAYGRLSASVIRLNQADFNKDITVTDEDVRKYYDAHKTELRTDEKRKVALVALALNDSQQKLNGRERVDALQKLADRATDFTQALLEKGADFNQVAARFQLPVEVTGDFTAAKPDPKMSQEGLGAAAFQLTRQEPNSDPIQIANGYAILHLLDITPARPLTLDEARPKIVEAIKAHRAQQAMMEKGAKVAHDVREGLKSGEPLSFALETANVKAEKVPPFTLMDESDSKQPGAKNQEKTQKPPDFLAIRSAAASLQPGEVSDFFPWENGGIIVVLEKREPPDEAKDRDKEKQFAERIEHNKSEIVFYGWLQQKQREAIAPAQNSEAKSSAPPRKS